MIVPRNVRPEEKFEQGSGDVQLQIAYSFGSADARLKEVIR